MSAAVPTYADCLAYALKEQQERDAQGRRSTWRVYVPEDYAQLADGEARNEGCDRDDAATVTT